jgi:hypothetical protein
MTRSLSAVDALPVTDAKLPRSIGVFVEDARGIYERACLTVIEGDVAITTWTGDIVSSGCGLLVGLAEALVLVRQLTDG